MSKKQEQQNQNNQEKKGLKFKDLPQKEQDRIREEFEENGRGYMIFDLEYAQESELIDSIDKAISEWGKKTAVMKNRIINNIEYCSSNRLYDKKFAEEREEEVIPRLIDFLLKRSKISEDKEKLKNLYEERWSKLD